ncbi:hypothetical protein VNO80_19344 [Phaseolus coccineus]|uniref:TF-B3 domain-containing protein n=1 Tax=Phaseolus coccineus TaxID=3886 RepID=A0AAN9MH45_PHACN
MLAENHFSVCINDKQLYTVKVSRIFFENHGIANLIEVILQLRERSWNVKLDSYCRFTKGWNDFMKECKLKGGDSLSRGTTVLFTYPFDLTRTKLAYQISPTKLNGGVQNYNHGELHALKVDPVEAFDVGAILSITRRSSFLTWVVWPL